MINLDLTKNENGIYILDRSLIEGMHRVVYEKFANGVEDKDNFVLLQDNKKIHCKYRECKESLYSELLFEKFCAKNGVRSAKIDIALEDGRRMFILSEDVNDDFSQGVEPERMFDIDSKKSISEYYSCARKYCLKKDINMDKDLFFKLMKMALADYLSANFDRNEGNFMFQIKEKEGGEIFTLAPLFDNEFAFAFDELDKVYENNKDKEIICNESNVIADTLSNIQVVKPDDFLPCISIQNKLEDREEYIKNLANEMVVDPRLIDILDNLNTNVWEMAEEIKQETGLEIPEMFCEFASELINIRKMVLLNKISEIEETYDAFVEKREEEE